MIDQIKHNEDWDYCCGLTDDLVWMPCKDQVGIILALKAIGQVWEKLQHSVSDQIGTQIKDPLVIYLNIKRSNNHD